MAIRPFTQAEAEKLVRVRNKHNGVSCAVGTVGVSYIYIGEDKLDFEIMLRSYEQMDGTPCGVELPDPEPELPDSMIDGQWASKDENGVCFISEEKPRIDGGFWSIDGDLISANIPSFADIPWYWCCFKKKSNKETK